MPSTVTGSHREPTQVASAQSADAANAGPALLARFDRLPIWPHPKSVLWLIGAGYFFGFFDILTIAVALPKIADQFHVSTTTAAMSITTSLVGYVVGALTIGNLADRFGRRFGLYASLGCFTIGSFLSALSPNMLFLDGARFLTGIGIGAEIAVVSTYIGELAPVAVRGRTAAKAGLFAAVAQVTVPLLARILVPDFADGWRILFLVGAMGALVTFVLRLGFQLPVTLPRLIASGRLVEARKVVELAEGQAESRTGRPLPPPAAWTESVSAPRNWRSAAGLLFTGAYLRRTLLMLTVWFVFYVGDYGWLTLAPTLLVKHGFPLKDSLTFVTVAGVGLVAGALIGSVVNDRIERKYTAAVALAVWAITMTGIGLFPVASVVMVLGFISNLTLGVLVFLMYIYTAENFPTACRSTGVALTDGLGHIGGALAPFFILGAYAITGFRGAFLAMALTGVLAALLLLTGIRTRRP